MLHALVLALAAASTHPDSLSSTLLTVEGRRVRLEQRLQIASLLEVLPDLDADGDRFVSRSELDRARERVFAYLGSHYELRTGTGGDLDGGETLMGRPVSLLLGAPDRTGAVEPVHVDVRIEYEWARELEDLVVETSLFLEKSPAHRDFASAVWNGASAGTVVLDASAPSWRFRPGGRGVWRDFFRAGVEHILGGWDHLAFVFALLFATRRLRALLGVVTAFTVAHSSTLALSVAGWVDFSAHARFVESAIALSIAYVAADHLIAPTRRRAHWLEAFAFGLVHGLGFAGFLNRSLVMETARTSALVAFNLGVESGQVLVVGAAALLLTLARRSIGPEEPVEFLAPRLVRKLGSAALVVIGLWAFATRAFA